MTNVHKLVVSNERPQIEFWSTAGEGGWFLHSTYLDNEHAEEALRALRATLPSMRYRLKPREEHKDDR